jgi:hypothetical protein
MSRILKLYERASSKNGQSDEEFFLSKSLYQREVERTGLKVCIRKDGSLFVRKPKRKIDTSITCPVCHSQFMMSKGKMVKHNYGGMVKVVNVCSSDCKDAIESIIPTNRLKNNCAFLY